MRNLYIIGNGFDLHHGLKSSYRDFRNWLEMKYPSIFQKIVNLWKDMDDYILWGDFENNLGKIDIIDLAAQISSQNYPNIASDEFRDSDWNVAEMEAERMFENIVNDIKKTLYNWVKFSVGKPMTDRKLKLIFQDSFFINFNYTDTLEAFYNIPSDQIFHIHGTIDSDNIIFGHGENYKEFENIETPWDGDMVFDNTLDECKYGISRMYKDVNNVIKKSRSHLGFLKEIKQVFVLGFSFSDVDLPYIEFFKKEMSNASWNISYYKDDEEMKFKHIFESYSPTINKCLLFRLQDLHELM